MPPAPNSEEGGSYLAAGRRLPHARTPHNHDHTPRPSAQHPDGAHSGSAAGPPAKLGAERNTKINPSAHTRLDAEVQTRLDARTRATAHSGPDARPDATPHTNTDTGTHDPGPTVGANSNADAAANLCWPVDAVPNAGIKINTNAGPHAKAQNPPAPNSEDGGSYLAAGRFDSLTHTPPTVTDLVYLLPDMLPTNDLRAITLKPNMRLALAMTLEFTPTHHGVPLDIHIYTGGCHKDNDTTWATTIIATLNNEGAPRFTFVGGWGRRIIPRRRHSTH